MAGRPGKYAAVTPNLPKLDAIEPERRELMNAVQAEILAAEPTTFNVGAQISSSLKIVNDRVQNVLALVKLHAAGKSHAAGFAGAYAEARVVLDAVADWKSSAQLLVDVYESLMLDRMDAEGVASLRLESGASVGTSSEPYGKVVDKEAFRLWCIAEGYESQLQLWPSTMNAIAKERTLAGEAPPDGVEVYAKTTVRLNKA